MDVNKLIFSFWDKIFIKKDVASMEYNLFLQHKANLEPLKNEIFNIPIYKIEESEQLQLEELTLDFFAFLRTTKDLLLKYKYRIINEDLLREWFNSVGFFIHPIFNINQLFQLLDIIYVYKNKGTTPIIQDILNIISKSNNFKINEFFLHRSGLIINDKHNLNVNLNLNVLVNDPLWQTNIYNENNVYPIKLPYFTILKELNTVSIEKNFLYLYIYGMLETSTSISSTEVSFPYLNKKLSIFLTWIFANSLFVILFEDLLPPITDLTRKVNIYKFFYDINLEDIDITNKFQLIETLKSIFDFFDISIYEIIANYLIENRGALEVLNENNLLNYIIEYWNSYNPDLFIIIKSLVFEIYPKLKYIFFLNIIKNKQKEIENILDYKWENDYFKFYTTLNRYYKDLCISLNEIYSFLDNFLNVFVPTNFFNHRYTTNFYFTVLQKLDIDIFNFLMQLKQNISTYTFSQKYTLLNFAFDLLQKISFSKELNIPVNELREYMLIEIIKFLKPIHARLPEMVRSNILTINDSLRNTLVIGETLHQINSVISVYNSIYTGKEFFNDDKYFARMFEQRKDLFNLDQSLMILDKEYKIDANNYILAPRILKIPSIWFGGSHNPNSSFVIKPEYEINVPTYICPTVLTNNYLEKSNFIKKEETSDYVKIYATHSLEPLYVSLKKIHISDELRNIIKNNYKNIKVIKDKYPNGIIGEKITSTSYIYTIPITKKNKKIDTHYYDYPFSIGEYLTIYDDIHLMHLKNISDNKVEYYTTTNDDFIAIVSEYNYNTSYKFIDFIKINFQELNV